jgi:hypothetical protein
MKMISKTDLVLCDCYLRVVKNRLEYCIKKMKGKYGTQDAVRNMKWAIKDIEQAISDDPKFELLNGFRNPPNTPKSRRLGWHKEGAIDEQ